MFNKILIANRGEIACRIMRTARRLGVKTVAVYSDADQHAMHVTMADEAVHIGPAPSRESYLRIDKIIAAALQTGAQAIHPGYGFLSENAEFCRACDAHGLVFIGPPVGAIEAMGSKSAAKSLLEKTAVPLVPGYHGANQDPLFLKQQADAMGYPVLLKAAAGGGGKGMRQVWSSEEFDEALAAAKRESMSSFNDEQMLVEKYLVKPRHVEIQVFCDSQGNGVYLYERDCSVQRRHQKVIEEAPAPGLAPTLRANMGEAALRAAKAINYCGAGTVEFLLDADGSFYFMEMNTRLQVEHPVTEMITGQDLVEWQLRVAAGAPLPLRQDQIPLQGHAFEARIYAEDPDNEFLPSAGLLSYLQPPAESAHVRVDTGVRQGDEVSSFYDPMIAKLVVWDESRERALVRLCNALADYRVAGLTTNIDFLYNLASSAPFRAAEVDTGFIQRHAGLLFRDDSEQLAADVPIAALALLLSRQQAVNSMENCAGSPWAIADAWRLNETHVHSLDLVFGQREITVTCMALPERSAGGFKVTSDYGEHTLFAELQGETLTLLQHGHRTLLTVVEHHGQYSIYRPFDGGWGAASGVIRFSERKTDMGDLELGLRDADLTAPMNGTIVALLAEPGSEVAANSALLVMEAMKMEHTIRAPCAGVVQQFYYAAGDLVEGGARLLAFEALAKD